MRMHFSCRRDAVTFGGSPASRNTRGGSMEVTAEYLNDSRFEVAAREHRVICDQPRENGGADSGMSPPEFLLASLATCAAYYAAQYLKVRNLSVQNLKVRVTA